LFARLSAAAACRGWLTRQRIGKEHPTYRDRGGYSDVRIDTARERVTNNPDKGAGANTRKQPSQALESADWRGKCLSRRSHRRP